MKVKEFIETLVEKNTLIRLWYKVKGGHEEALEPDTPRMEHQILRSNFVDRKVIGITDILYQRSPYIEAVNLVIERGEEDYFETERSNCTICDVRVSASDEKFYDGSKVDLHGLDEVGQTQ